MAEVSPMMQNYLDKKAEYQDSILFYRLGDFYEMFYDDAILASRELEITLTGRACGTEEKVTIPKRKMTANEKKVYTTAKNLFTYASSYNSHMLLWR